MKKELSDLEKAKLQVEKKKKFYNHLTTYLIVNIFLLLINLRTGPIFLWCIFPAVGWGIGLAFEAVEVFGTPFYGESWEDREIQKELEKIEAKKRRYRELSQDADLDREEQLELKELQKLRPEWDDSDFV